MGWTVFLIPGALGAAAVIYQALRTAADRRTLPPPGNLTSVGGHRLHCRCLGSGSPTVVFEAGIAASSLTWSRIQPRIARISRACSYDRAGLAWSERSRRERSMPQLVGELHQLLEQGRIPPPYVLVGHSFGGIVIRAFARAYPQEVVGLVFVDPLHPEEWCEPSSEQRRRLRGAIFLSRVGAVLAHLGVVRLSLALLAGGATAAPRRLSRVFGRSAANLLEHMVEEVQKLPPEVLPAVQAHWSHPKAFRGMWQHLAALPECSSDVMRETDAFGSVPVFVLSSGARSARWLAADAALASASSRGRHIVSHVSGHWVHLDDPELVVQTILDAIEMARRS